MQARKTPQKSNADHEHWRFRVVNGHTEIIPPARLSEDVIPLLADILFAEIHHRTDLDLYRQIWAEMLTDPEAAKDGMAGNGTYQSVDGDDVILGSLYDLYKPVRMPKQEFELFLDEYGQFLEGNKPH